MEANQEQHIKSPEYYLFLDDYRFPFLVWWVNLPEKESHKWVIARHYYDFVHIIQNNGLPKFISFDHDLDRQALPVYTEQTPGKNGMDCVKWLINICEINNLPFPACAVHSTNPTDGPKMGQVITEYINSKNK